MKGIVIVVLAAALAGCASRSNTVPPGTVDADKFLFDRGMQEGGPEAAVQAYSSSSRTTRRSRGPPAMPSYRSPACCRW